MAAHSCILAWKVPWTEEPDGLQSMKSQRGDMSEHLSTGAVLSPSLYLINTLHQETREKEGNLCKCSLVISVLFVTLDKLSG